MQDRKLILIAVLIVVGLVLSGCGMVESMLGTSGEADQMGDSGASNDQVSEPVEPAAPAIDPAIAALLPSEPAPVGSDFRSDSPQVVAATGRPQLLEFFTYW